MQTTANPIVTERFTLNPFVKAALRHRTPEFGFGMLGAAVYYRTYSRLTADGGQESWADTVIRVVEGVCSIRKWWQVSHGLPWDEEAWQGIARRMADAIFAMRFLPPGRGLWSMGTDYVYERGAMALQNCFSGDTEIMTDQGLAQLIDLVGRQIQVPVRDGGWTPAEVRAFGVQPTQMVELQPVYPQSTVWNSGRSGERRTIRVTPNHRWILADGRETTMLATGDVVAATTLQVDRDSDDAINGFVHGLVFADGARGYRRDDGVTTYELRLCGAKTRYATLFERVGARVSYPATYGGDARIGVPSTLDLKSLPTTASPEYLAGFIDGWLAGDGDQPRPGMHRLSTTDLKAGDWLRRHAPYAGYLVVGHHIEADPTNYGERSAPLLRLLLTARERAWRVTAITAADSIPVYCAVVPGTRQFTLAGGIQTGNCGYTDVTVLSRDAAWTMDALMCGVGTGWAVKSATFELQRPASVPATIYRVPDSREGWVESLRLLIQAYEQGSAPLSFDYREIRPAGAPIRGFGGTASGSAPLEKLHERIRGYLDAHVAGQTSRTRLIADVMNAIGACVVAGNVRRSAEIGLGSPYDTEFLNLKNYELNPDRAEIGWMSNNTVVLSEIADFKKLPDIAELIRLNGEPGVMNLLNIQKYGRYGDEMPDLATGCNPCAEQPLEDKEVCCLVEVFPTKCATPQEFYEALELAQIYAHTVSLLPTHSPETNAVVARNHRIGESLSGIADWFDTVGATDIISMMRTGYTLVREVNQRLARAAGIAESVRVTTVKPSGTVSQLAGVSPGMHYPPYTRYIRRMRVGANTPLVPFLIDAGLPHEPDTYSDNTLVFEFPVESRARRSQREISMWQKGMMVMLLQKHWSDNMVSNTITFDPKTEGHQIEDFLAHVVPFTKTISLLPDIDEGAYAQMPYETITKAEYDRRKAEVRPIDWARFGGSDGEDSRFCSNDGCEVL